MKVVTTVKELLKFAALAIVPNATVTVETSEAAKSPLAKTDASKQNLDSWLLAGRDGECVPLSILAKKGPAYANIKIPDDLAAKLRVNGHKAEIKEFKAGTRPAVELKAPSARIHAMCVSKELCDKRPPAPEAK